MYARPLRSAQLGAARRDGVSLTKPLDGRNPASAGQIGRADHAGSGEPAESYRQLLLPARRSVIIFLSAHADDCAREYRGTRPVALARQ